MPKHKIFKFMKTLSKSFITKIVLNVRTRYVLIYLIRYRVGTSKGPAPPIGAAVAMENPSHHQNCPKAGGMKLRRGEVLFDPPSDLLLVSSIG